MKVTVVYYSQSGQGQGIVESLVRPFIEKGDVVHFEHLRPVHDFPFPWNGFAFFNAFPETFLMKPMELHPVSPSVFEGSDLVILGYQPWFLTPSRPISSFLQSEEGKRALNGKKIVTVLGSRNMWLGAQEKVKRLLKDAGATLVGHIALADRSGNLTSLVTILRWMFTGKKDAFLFFPPAGVSQEDIQRASIFGMSIREALATGEVAMLQEKLNEQGAIDILPNLVLMERRGQKSFSLWSRFISSGGGEQSIGRKVRVYMFMFLLPTVIIILSPLLWVLSRVLLTVKQKELLDEVRYYCQNGLR